MKITFIAIIVVVLVVLISGGWTLLSQRSSVPLLTPSPAPSATRILSPTMTASPSAVSTLPTKYIFPVDWPPKVSNVNKPFSCLEAGSEASPGGQTQKVVVNNHTYCVTKETQGAAGSIYTQYAYARAKNNQTEIFTFSLRFVQCGNYPEPEKTACERESQTFRIDTFIDHYIQSNS